MAKFIKAALTARTCGPLPFNATKSQRNQIVIEYLQQVISRVCHQKPDLLLLPEMCDLPLNMPFEEYVAQAYACDNTVLDFISQVAIRHNMWIAFSTIKKTTSGKLRNACMLINRNGQIECEYCKIHLTQGEIDAGLEPGTKTIVHECELGKVGFAICFDLNYTQLAEEYKRLGTNLILFPALFHGGVLQNMWALSARSYLICSGGNVGASIIQPTGEALISSTNYYQEVVYKINLDYAVLHLDFNMPKLEQALIKYEDKIKITDPGYLASVLLSSEDDSLPINQVIDEFTMEKLDDYLERLSLLTNKDNNLEEKA